MWHRASQKNKKPACAGFFATKKHQAASLIASSLGAVVRIK